MVMRFRCAWYSLSVRNVLFHLLLSKKRHILLGIVHVQIRRSFCLTISSTLVHISFHFKFFLTFFFFPFLCRKSPLYIHELGLQIKVILFLLMLLPYVSSRSHFSSFLNWNWVQSQVMCLQGDVTFSIKL